MFRLLYKIIKKKYINSLESEKELFKSLLAKIFYPYRTNPSEFVILICLLIYLKFGQLFLTIIPYYISIIVVIIKPFVPFFGKVFYNFHLFFLLPLFSKLYIHYPSDVFLSNNLIFFLFFCFLFIWFLIIVDFIIFFIVCYYELTAENYSSILDDIVGDLLSMPHLVETFKKKKLVNINNYFLFNCPRSVMSFRYWDTDTDMSLSTKFLENIVFDRLLFKSRQGTLFYSMNLFLYGIFVVNFILLFIFFFLSPSFLIFLIFICWFLFIDYSLNHYFFFCEIDNFVEFAQRFRSYRRKTHIKLFTKQKKKKKIFLFKNLTQSVLETIDNELLKEHLTVISKKKQIQIKFENPEDDLTFFRRSVKRDKNYLFINFDNVLPPKKKQFNWRDIALEDYTEQEEEELSNRPFFFILFSFFYNIQLKLYFYFISPEESYHLNQSREDFFESELEKDYISNPQRYEETLFEEQAAEKRNDFESKDIYLNKFINTNYIEINNKYFLKDYPQVNQIKEIIFFDLLNSLFSKIYNNIFLIENRYLIIQQIFDVIWFYIQKILNFSPIFYIYKLLKFLQNCNDFFLIHFFNFTYLFFPEKFDKILIYEILFFQKLIFLLENFFLFCLKKIFFFFFIISQIKFYNFFNKKFYLFRFIDLKDLIFAYLQDNAYVNSMNYTNIGLDEMELKLEDDEVEDHEIAKETFCEPDEDVREHLGFLYSFFINYYFFVFFNIFSTLLFFSFHLFITFDFNLIFYNINNIYLNNFEYTIISFILSPLFLLLSFDYHTLDFRLFENWGYTNAFFDILLTKKNDEIYIHEPKISEEEFLHPVYVNTYQHLDDPENIYHLRWNWLFLREENNFLEKSDFTFMELFEKNEMNVSDFLENNLNKIKIDISEDEDIEDEDIEDFDKEDEDEEKVSEDFNENNEEDINMDINEGYCDFINVDQEEIFEYTDFNDYFLGYESLDTQEFIQYLQMQFEVQKGDKDKLPEDVPKNMIGEYFLYDMYKDQVSIVNDNDADQIYRDNYELIEAYKNYSRFNFEEYERRYEPNNYDNLMYFEQFRERFPLWYNLIKQKIHDLILFEYLRTIYYLEFVYWKWIKNHFFVLIKIIKTFF